MRLDIAQSSAQKLNINPSTGDNPLILSNVPIDYMDGLNGAAFIAGDRVVIEFADQDWSKPKVIGFESNPRGVGGVPGTYYAFYIKENVLKINHLFNPVKESIMMNSCN